MIPRRPSKFLPRPDGVHWINGPQCHLYCETVGEGAPPLLLIPGLGADLITFFPQVEGLRGRYPLILLDNRGAGRSQAPDIPYSMDAMAEDAAEILSALGHRRAHVMGVSMGGFIAQRLAIQHPERVSSLILCATHFGGQGWISPDPAALAPLLEPLPDPEANIRRNLRAFSAPPWADANPEIVDWYAQERVRTPTPPVGYARQLEAALQWDNKGDLEKIRARTLILHGGADPVVPVANAHLLGESIPGAEVHILEGAGHMTMMEAPERVNAAIAAFIDEAQS